MILFLAKTAAERNGPETRKEILNLLGHEPGLTKSQICKRLGLAWGTVSHHTRVLEREALLQRKRLLGFNRLYGREARGLEASLMPLLRESLVPHLLERVAGSPGIGIQALAKELNLGRKIVRRQLEALVETGLMERSEDYRPKFFLLEKGRQFVEGPEGQGPARPDHDETSMHV